jgi:hypothetical protein
MNILSSGVVVYKTGFAGQSITFSAQDFEEAVGVTKISSITILSLPDKQEGSLCLSGMEVLKNQIISRDFLSLLTFEPATDQAVDCRFTFGVVSSSGPLALECSLSLVDELNFAPTSAVPEEGYFSLTTLSGVSLYSTLDGNDPDGDEIFFRILSYPENGTLRMTDRNLGSFVYTPLSGYTGKDSFTYLVTDQKGNSGREVTVWITVEEPLVSLSYSDLKGNAAELPAIRLAEMGITVGKSIGGKSYFEPDMPITFGEFLAWSMISAGMNPADADWKGNWQKSYEAMAQEAGILNSEESLDFQTSISWQEAAEILCSAFGISGENSQSVVDQTVLAVLLSSDFTESDVMTRGEAAVFLYTWLTEKV